MERIILLFAEPLKICGSNTVKAPLAAFSHVTHVILCTRARLFFTRCT